VTERDPEPGADNAADARLTAILACSACGGSLTDTEAALRCDGCLRSFPVIAGIPDMRLAYEDPYVSWGDDLLHARELSELSDALDFEDLLRELWRRSGKRPELAERFLAGDLVSLRRSRAYVEALERRRGPLGPDDRFLEIGCGTAGLAAAAGDRAGTIVASDVSMRWLVLARKRLDELGRQDVDLVCCSAEEPPFHAGWFDVVGASDVIEHASRQADFVSGCAHVLRRGGVLFLITPNRFSLGLEPHVRLWGVGWLPRRLAPAYVRRVRGAPYDHVRLLSSVELRRMLAGRGLAPRIEVPEIPSATQEIYHGLELLLVRVYNRVRRVGLVRRALLLVGPFFHVFAMKGIR
jgi:ubiquinone/menaquinone biosynthesis C-methylase UbiE/uncharacterized protein YbaR (Trm112 family)